MNINSMLENFKMRMRAIGHEDEAYIDQIAYDIMDEVRTSINEAVEEAFNQALYMGYEKSSEEFLEQLMIVSNDGLFTKIATESGQLDFSVPSWPMLPSLLKGGKISKDGTIYRVIPIDNNKTVGYSTVDTIKAMNMSQKELAAEVKRKKQEKKKRIANPDFRTATSKQNPSAQWVHPGFDRDFSGFMQALNDNLENTIYREVNSIFQKYERALW